MTPDRAWLRTDCKFNVDPEPSTDATPIASRGYGQRCSLAHPVVEGGNRSLHRRGRSRHAKSTCGGSGRDRDRYRNKCWCPVCPQFNRNATCRRWCGQSYRTCRRCTALDTCRINGDRGKGHLCIWIHPYRSCLAHAIVSGGNCGSDR
jgi:hypothetical protein